MAFQYLNMKIKIFIQKILDYLAGIEDGMASIWQHEFDTMKQTFEILRLKEDYNDLLELSAIRFNITKEIFKYENDPVLRLVNEIDLDELYISQANYTKLIAEVKKQIVKEEVK